MTANPAAELKYDSAPRRRAAMLSMIVDAGFCTIAELAAAFAVSEMTVRRDIAKLASEERSLRIVHGGIGSAPGWQSDGTDYRTRAIANRSAKRAIAAAAVALLHPGQTVALDSGTTALHVAEAIPNGLPLNVVTQSLAVVNRLAPQDSVEITLLGGTFVRALQGFVGTATTRAVAELRVDLLFLATTSIDERGVLAGNEYDAATKRALIEAAGEVVLIADSTKFDRRSRFRVCPLHRVATMVTDAGITPAQRGMMEAAGIRVMVAGPAPAA